MAHFSFLPYITQFALLAQAFARQILKIIIGSATALFFTCQYRNFKRMIHVCWMKFKKRFCLFAVFKDFVINAKPRDEEVQVALCQLCAL